MNRKNFLKTGILGAIIGFICPSLVANNSTNISVPKTSKLVDNSQFRVISSFCCSGKLTSEKEREKIAEIEKVLLIPHFPNEGTYEDIIYRNHLNTLYIMSRAIAEHDTNKHLNLDSLDLFNKFKEEYKITNINT